jgi:hypothetical protein
MGPSVRFMNNSFLMAHEMAGVPGDHQFLVVFSARTVTGLAAREMIAAFRSLRAESRRMPRNSRCSQMRRRIAGMFSPIPAVKTRVSRPPRDQKLVGQPVKAKAPHLIGIERFELCQGFPFAA